MSMDYTQTKKYETCEKCGATRNATIAPECPICKEDSASLARASVRKIAYPQTLRMMCPMCEEVVKPVHIKYIGEGWEKICPQCEIKLPKSKYKKKKHGTNTG